MCHPACRVVMLNNLDFVADLDPAGLISEHAHQLAVFNLTMTFSPSAEFCLDTNGSRSVTVPLTSLLETFRSSVS